MSAIPFAPTLPKDLDEVSEELGGWTPWGGAKPKPKQLVNELVIHEDGSPLKFAFIEKTGKSTVELEREMRKIVEDGAKQGIEMFKESEDWQRIRMLEKRTKPVGYAHAFNGLDSELALYRNGKWVYDDYALIEVSRPHYRTWGVGGYIDVAGQIHREKWTREEFQQHWEATKRFSKIVWVESWEEFKAIP